jgi:hypothetical protein
MEDFAYMKKLLMFSLALVVFSGVASATTACASNTVYTPAQLGSSGCELGDKVFANFGTLPTGIGLLFVQTGIGVNATYSLDYVDTTTNGTGLEQSFTESYTLTIDTTVCALCYVKTAAAGVDDGNGNGNGVLTKALSAGASGTSTETDVNGTLTPVVITGLTATSFTVTDTWTYTNGVFLNLSNSYTQGQTSASPEPISMFLFGSGLMAFATIGRRKLSRK